MKRITFGNRSDVTPGSGLNNKPRLKFSMPGIKINTKWALGILTATVVLLVLIFVTGYFLIARPLLTIAAEAKEVKATTSEINAGLAELSFTKIQNGLDNTKAKLAEFKTVYEDNMRFIRKLPGAESYYQDSQHMVRVAEEGIELGELTVNILEPYAGDLGFATAGKGSTSLPAQERIIKLLRLMPEFSPNVSEISDRMQRINDELAQIDASHYPQSLPRFVSYFGVDPQLNVREQILGMQSISRELAQKAPQFESMFNAVPDFMGLNETKRYLILMHNNYELRMSGGFNTYIVAVEFSEGIPEIIYSIDTYFIDEGERTGTSRLVNRNVPYFLRNYLYLSGNIYRLYARDATSVSPDFPTAADSLLTEFWYKDPTLPQNIDGIIVINNDLAVDILRVVGPVNTEKYSIRTDQGTYITIPVTEFNADNVITELEEIAGGKLAQTIGRKEIIKFLGQSILEKIFTSEATNLVNIAKVSLDSLSKKDVMLYSFDPNVHQAFADLGYSGEIIAQPEGWDYMHVSRSNFGSGKADWTKPGFVTQTVEKNIEDQGGRKISTVKVTIHNPKRPSWYNIDPCCFYNAYMRVYVPMGSKMVSVDASDGQDVHTAEFTDEILGKTFIETFTRQLKETNLTITYKYELPDSVNTGDGYGILIQRQPGTSVDEFTVGVGGVSEKVLLDSDKMIEF